MRRSAAGLLVLTVLAACGRPGPPADGPTAEESGRAPYGPGIEVGETYRYELYVHCGIEWARIDGTWWHTTRLDDGYANPPDGWGNPFDSGWLDIVDADTAEYRGQADAAIRFTRGDLVDPPLECL